MFSPMDELGADAKDQQQERRLLSGLLEKEPRQLKEKLWVEARIGVDPVITKD